MAGELNAKASVTFERTGDDPSTDAFDMRLSIADEPIASGTLIVGTSEEAIPVQDVAAPLGLVVLENLHGTAQASWRSASGASNDHVRIPPRGFALFHCGDDVTAPYLVSDTVSTPIKFRIYSR